MATRKIFKYFNGSSEVYADPMVLDRRLLKSTEGVDFISILSMVEGPEWIGKIARTDPDGKSYDKEGNFLPEATESNIKLAVSRQEEGVQELIPILYQMFDLKPLQPDGSGTTEEEILNAFSSYNEFIGSLKKSTENEPSLPQSSDTVPEVTANGSGSGTIGSEPLPFTQSL